MAALSYLVYTENRLLKITFKSTSVDHSDWLGEPECESSEEEEYSEEGWASEDEWATEEEWTTDEEEPVASTPHCPVPAPRQV